jgi:hypothetical protein
MTGDEGVMKNLAAHLYRRNFGPGCRATLNRKPERAEASKVSPDKKTSGLFTGTLAARVLISSGPPQRK